MSKNRVERCCTHALVLHAGTSLNCLGRSRSQHRGARVRLSLNDASQHRNGHVPRGFGSMDAATEAAAASRSNAITRQGRASRPIIATGDGERQWRPQRGRGRNHQHEATCDEEIDMLGGLPRSVSTRSRACRTPARWGASHGPSSGANAARS